MENIFTEEICIYGGRTDIMCTNCCEFYEIEVNSYNYTINKVLINFFLGFLSNYICIKQEVW